MPAPTEEQRLSVRQKPAEAPVMFQSWADLLFLHWRWDPAEVQATLPPGLHVDTFEGEAWMGVVPFWMERVRPRGLPPVPGLSWFLELNLRTYVHDENGTPGVWFYSLDCNQSIAVTIARTLFGLNYVHARQSGQRRAVPAHNRFHSQRRHTGGQSHFDWHPEGPDQPAEPGSREFFLTERYTLFSCHRGKLMTGRVWHEPYPLNQASIERADTDLWVDQDFAPPNRAPDHTLCSPGVSVSIYPLRQVA